MYLSRHTKQEQAAGAEETEETEARVPTSVVFFSRRICLPIPLYIRRPLVSFVRLFVRSSRVLLCLSSRLVSSRPGFFFFFSFLVVFPVSSCGSLSLSRSPDSHSRIPRPRPYRPSCSRLVPPIPPNPVQPSLFPSCLIGHEHSHRLPFPRHRHRHRPMASRTTRHSPPDPRSLFSIQD